MEVDYHIYEGEGFDTSSNNNPSILHVCHQAGNLATRFYKLCFGDESSLATVPFDFARDILFMDDWSRFDTKVFEDIQNHVIAFDTSHFADSSEF